MTMYRFVYLRSFHKPIIVRLEVQPDGTGIVVAKVASGKGGYDPGRLIRNRKRAVPKKQVDEFLGLVQDEEFWETGPQRRLGLDGATWTIQGIHDQRLYSRTKWSPGAGPFRDAGLMLLDLSGLKVDAIY